MILFNTFYSKRILNRFFVLKLANEKSLKGTRPIRSSLELTHQPISPVITSFLNDSYILFLHHRFIKHFTLYSFQIIQIVKIPIAFRNNHQDVQLYYCN